MKLKESSYFKFLKFCQDRGVENPFAWASEIPEVLRGPLRGIYDDESERLFAHIIQTQRMPIVDEYLRLIGVLGESGEYVYSGCRSNNRMAFFQQLESEYGDDFFD